MTWITVIVFTSLIVGIVEPAKTFRWCAYDKEMTKCQAFVKTFPTLANLTNVKDVMVGECVKITSDEDCMMKIKENKADFITLDGGKVYAAGKNYELVPIVGELTDDKDLGYYAVAVAKKSTSITLKKLKGKTTCHTGYMKTSGWVFPIGHLLKNQDGFRTGCGDKIDVQSASKYFKESCVPGVPSGYDNLCALCPGKNCKSDGNAYAGYHGAFKCMMSGGGDVAFVKHLTTAEVVGDKTSDYKYLCTDGTTKEVNKTSHMNCNLGQSKSHTVVARAGDNKDIVKMLVRAGAICRGNTTAQCNGFNLFDSKSFGGANLLFKDSAIALEDVGDKNTYKKWLGTYADDVEALNKKGAPCAACVIVTAVPTLISFATIAIAKNLL